ncbi:MAG: bacillithiol biosynthesis cysteine-adding enzyme BshC [Balneolaceae bacterium]|nr:bacillithiol biosynthesis cysteine-adding enzyme BshC [Balneolaceae bacterium]
MKVSKHPLSSLGASFWHQQVAQAPSSLTELLHHADWTDDATWRNATKDASAQLSISRDSLADALADLHTAWNPSKKTLANIESLRDPATVVMVTGQQCNLFGGPSLIAHKALSVILQSKKLTNRLGRQVIPVFWLADEDHDLAEVLEGHAWGASLDDVFDVQLEWDSLSKEQRMASTRMVGSLALPASVRQATESWHVSDSVRETMSRAYEEGCSLRDGMARWISALFGHHGLVLFSRQHETFHQASAPLLSRAVSEVDSITQALALSTEAVLASGGHQQAAIDGTTVFHVTDSGERLKWTQDQGQWRHAAMPHGETWDAATLADTIHQHPETASPNVFMRLVLQSALLPVVGAAMGPSELAYAGQSTKMFEWAGLRQPVWMPRYSLTLLDGGKQPWLDELGLDWTAFRRPLHELQTSWVNALQPQDIETALSTWETSIHDQAKDLAKQVSALDATLEASVDAGRARMNKELERVRTKIRRAIRRRESVQMNRMERLASRVMPAGALQERTIATWSVLSHFGDHVFDHLMESLEGQEPDGHFLVQFEGVRPVEVEGVKPVEVKASIRQQALQERQSMSSQEYVSRSLNISETLIAQIKEAKPTKIATFLPKIDVHEPDIRPAIEAAWALGIEVMVPKWSLLSPEMTFVSIATWDDVTVDDQGYLQPHRHEGRAPSKGEPHTHKMGEPMPNTPTPDSLLPESSLPDILWIPAVALDTQGGRIGYGKGYFDRAIHAMTLTEAKASKHASQQAKNGASTQPQRWAVCFSSWVYTDPLPQGPHDQTMHRIITENGILNV